VSHRILLVDDHQMFREGLKALLQSETNFSIAGEAEDGLQAVELCRELAPDVVVMDISMPGINGVEAARRIHEESPDVKIIILSMYTEKRFILGALKAGATGIVAKNSASAELVAGPRLHFDEHDLLSMPGHDVDFAERHGATIRQAGREEEPAPRPLPALLP